MKVYLNIRGQVVRGELLPRNSGSYKVLLDSAVRGLSLYEHIEDVYGENEDNEKVILSKVRYFARMGEGFGSSMLFSDIFVRYICFSDFHPVYVQSCKWSLSRLNIWSQKFLDEIKGDEELINNHEYTKKISCNKNYTISIKIRYLLGENSIVKVISSVILLKFHKPVDFSNCKQHIQEVTDVLSLCFGSIADPKKVVFYGNVGDLSDIPMTALIDLRNENSSDKDYWRRFFVSIFDLEKYYEKIIEGFFLVKKQYNLAYYIFFNVHEDNCSLERRLFYIFQFFETVSSNGDKGLMIPKEKFNRIKKKIKKVIFDSCSELDIDDYLRDEMSSKIKDLNKKNVRLRILNRIDGFDEKLIFPNESKEGTESKDSIVDRLLKFRNDFVHSSSAEPLKLDEEDSAVWALYQNSYRILVFLFLSEIFQSDDEANYLLKKSYSL